MALQILVLDRTNPHRGDRWVSLGPRSAVRPAQVSQADQNPGVRASERIYSRTWALS